MSPSPKASYARTLYIGSLVALLSLGVRATFGLFMQPMGLENGWGRDVFSMAFAIQNLFWGVGSIFMGILADRFGSGRTIAVSALLYALGMFGMYYSHTEMQLYFTAGLLVGLGQAGTTFPVILPVVARAVPLAYRSTAMGLASAGGMLGQFLIVPGAQVLITSTDWTSALWVMSLLMAAAIPLAVFLKGRPDTPAGTLSLGGAVRQALAHKSFHLLFWSYFVCGFHTAFVTLHLPAYLTDGGLNAGHGATALALIGLFNIFGCYGAGKLGERISKKTLLAWVYFLRVFGIIWLISLPMTPFVVYVFAAWMGLFWLGTVPLTLGLIGQIYGLRYASTLSGIAFLGHQVGSFVGVWWGGYAYQTTGSYTMVWMVSIALGLLAAVLCLPIKERPLAAPAAA
ncbi:MFS transporter [Pusillimonas sp.]|uniref:MFS transporter n=1 Tax=Pusillimonas sp. TaxID=3040095 RepID=UPI0037C689EA